MSIAAAISGLCLAAACWTRCIQSSFPAGWTRVLLTAPVVALFQYLPVHFQAEDVLLVVLLSACLSWWATFKVIAMGLGRGPLRTSMTMPQYAVALLLPVTVDTGKRRCGSSLPSDGMQSSSLLLSFIAKGGLLSAIVYVLTSFSLSDMTRHLLYGVPPLGSAPSRPSAM
ncbi:hypothetical protein CYMTET_31607 [Cymbomonas tetramitiformis]|uniref:Uncharacterized protein n=1 Tax=Cymbomonas tetramitiformis TaxID=36881 RepID=A0AAE0FH73_9CHLO|nr:hypothetical protein CYMTET_31607 [Cymbomonas tetramitiformis]